MTADLELVSRLQTLDLKIGELQREVATLPKHIAQIEKTLDSHLRRLEADRAALSANQKERKGLEDEIKVQEQKVSKLRDQMLGAKNNEQYKAFQNEIEYGQNEVRKHEDRILDLMSESEPLVHPYIPNSAPDVRAAMLREVGVASVDELYAAIPEALRLRRKLDLPAPLPLLNMGTPI